MITDTAAAQPADCPRCGKPLALCICDAIKTFDNRIELLILQHPQEQDRLLGTARLTVAHLQHAQLKIGLSWPSLARALGRAADPQRWAVLYLGSLKARTVAANADLIAVDRKGAALVNQAQILRNLEGVVLLDGTWSQAKALWWRNPWMLKCRRVILNPARPSLYGNLRREPRSDGLATIEAAAMLISRLQGDAEIEAALLASFEQLLARYRSLQKTTPGFDAKMHTKDGRSKGIAKRQRRQQRS